MKQTGTGFVNWDRYVSANKGNIDSAQTSAKSKLETDRSNLDSWGKSELDKWRTNTEADARWEPGRFAGGIPSYDASGFQAREAEFNRKAANPMAAYGPHGNSIDSMLYATGMPAPQSPSRATPMASGLKDRAGLYRREMQGNYDEGRAALKRSSDNEAKYAQNVASGSASGLAAREQSNLDRDVSINLDKHNSPGMNAVNEVSYYNPFMAVPNAISGNRSVYSDAWKKIWGGKKGA